MKSLCPLPQFTEFGSENFRDKKAYEQPWGGLCSKISMTFQSRKSSIYGQYYHRRRDLGLFMVSRVKKTVSHLIGHR